jgi:hypothetical protein
MGIVSARLDMDVDLILSASCQRTVALARSIICCLDVDQLTLSGDFISFRMLGILSSSGRRSPAVFDGNDSTKKPGC